MLSEITEYLYNFNDSEWHELNTFLLNKFPDVGCETVRETLVRLVEDKRIEIKDRLHKKLNGESRINDWNYKNSYRDLTNLPIYAKLHPVERKNGKGKRCT